MNVEEEISHASSDASLENGHHKRVSTSQASLNLLKTMKYSDDDTEGSTSPGQVHSDSSFTHRKSDVSGIAELSPTLSIDELSQSSVSQRHVTGSSQSQHSSQSGSNLDSGVETHLTTWTRDHPSAASSSVTSPRDHHDNIDESFNTGQVYFPGKKSSSHVNDNNSIMYGRPSHSTLAPSSHTPLTVDTKQANRFSNVLNSSTDSMDLRRSLSPLSYSAAFRMAPQSSLSSPLARVHTPDPDKTFSPIESSSANKRRPLSASMSPDIRSFLVEKEVIESQLRKLQVENTTLQTENKLLKDKYNRAQARISSLEGQLNDSHKEADQLHEDLSSEMTAIKKKYVSEMEREKQDLERKIVQMNKEMEMLKAENDSLEKQLDAARKTADVVKYSSDQSKIMEAFKTDAMSLQEELKQVKRLLQQSEVQCQQEVDRRKEATQQIVKLTELKTLLQQELENSGSGSVADKQVKSLERRLKITEDRLHQERADRAGKLSEVEEKLINENAKLQVSEKEVRRQLQRERDKHKNLDNKLRELKKENEKLRISGPDDSTSSASSLSKYSGRIHIDSRKHNEEITRILDSLEQQNGLRQGQEKEMIWLLWQQKEGVAKQLREWELELKHLDVNTGAIREGLKAIRDERDLYEQRLIRFKDAVDDLTKEKEDSDNTYKSQIHSLLEEKHSTLAHNKNLGDLMAALKAENESLKESLRLTGGATMPTKDKSSAKSYEAQIEELTWELRNTQAELQQRQRAQKLQDSEFQTVKSQLHAKELSLDEALRELERSANTQNADLSNHRQHKIDKLNAEIRGLHAEVKLWHDKYENLSTEKKQLEEKVDLVQKTKSRPLHASKGTSESNNQDYESELNERDTQIMKLTVQYNEVENQLQRAKQNLLLEQENSVDITAQLDELMVQLRQKQRVIDKMCSSEHEHQMELSAIRDSLAANNRELTQKTSELKLVAIGLNSEREKVLKLQRDMASRDSIINRGMREAIEEGRIGSLSSDQQSARESLTEAEQRARMLQYDNDTLQNNVSKLSEQMDLIVSENAELVNKVRQVKQELIKERAMVCQLTTEKVDAEQRLKICMEERDSLQKDNTRMARDLTKHELDTKETLQKLEMEAMKAHVEYEDRNKHLSSEGKRIAYELESCKRLLEGRDKEINMLQDNLNRYKMELDTQNRKNAMLKEEIQTNREDIEKLTNELSVKMKENVASVEVNQLLGSERNKMVEDKQTVEKDLHKERESVKKYMLESNNLHMKLAKAEENLRQSLQECHEKQNQMVAMETELRHVNRSQEHSQAERAQFKQQIDQLNTELRRVNSTNASLQRQLDLENKTLAEEKTVHSQLRDNLESTSRQMSQARQEHEILKASYETERRTVQQLKEQCQAEEDRSYQLLEQVHSLEVEVNTLQGQLAASKENLDDSRRTKQSLYNDLQDLCKKLSEKDEIITKLQEKCNETVDVIQREFAMEKTHITRDKESTEEELKRTKKEMNELNEKLKQKDAQLDTFERTLRDLESATRTSQDLELKIQNMEAEIKDARLSIGNLKTENESLSKANKKLQETVDRLTQTNDSLKEQCRSQKDTTSVEVMEIRQKMSDQASRYEIERSDLKDRLNKVIANLKATEVSLSAVTETKDHLYESNKKFEKTVDTIKSQLHEEITMRKLAEQKVESLKAQVDELHHKRGKYDDRLSELQSALAKTEAELILEREKVKKYQEEHNDTENVARTHETRSQVLATQVNDLQAEVASLKEQLDNQKQHLSGKNKRASHEIKQQAELFEKERGKLSQQIQQLTRDLDQTREQLASKNKENLKMHEEILNAEEKAREAQREVKQAQDALKMEAQVKDQMEKRNLEVEEELLRSRNAMKGDFDPSVMDTTKAEMSKMMQDMQRQMQQHLDSQRNSEKEGKARENKMTEDFKKRIYELESQLNQEQAINIVIKTQLQSLEDENARLRLQLQAAKRRQDRSRDRSTKSRMEEINEIIAKSQARAQQMLSSGSYNEETLRAMNNPTSAFPFMPMTGTFSTFNRHSMSSPEPRSHASDDFNHSFNGSLLNGVSGFSEHLNNQSTLPLGSPREFRGLSRLDKTSTP